MKKETKLKEVIIILSILLLASVVLSILLAVEKKGTINEETPKEIIKSNGCSDECESSSCDVFTYIDCIQDEKGCGHNQERGILLGKCGVDCLSDLNCEKGQICTHNYKCGIIKPDTQSMEDLFKSRKEELDRQKAIDDKLDRCTRLCADQEYGILATKDRCYKECYDVYYNKGETGLNEYIAGISTG